MKKAKEKPDTLSEKYLLEHAFEKPIVLLTYDDDVRINDVKVSKYAIKVDSQPPLDKLQVLFAFPLSKYEDIKSGIRLNKQVAAQKLGFIKKIKERPHVADEKEYEDGTDKSVCTTMRTGHVLSGKQVVASEHNLILRIGGKIVLVYKHGILKYEVEAADQ